jgi:NAD-dependent deacetylase
MLEVIPYALALTLRNARAVAVLTGAGVSAESGVPTFRDAQTGLWARFDPRELATPGAFARNPKLVWDWYAWRRVLVTRAQPNAGHRALAAMEEHLARGGGEFALITQNVDGLHAAAGSVRVVELHGNIRRVKCSREHVVVEDWGERGHDVPRCGRCGAYLRPDVVWFEEALPRAALQRAEAAARSCELFLAVGTSAEVYPAAGLAHHARACGATIAEINPDATPLSAIADHVVHAAAGTALPALVAAAWPSADPL